MAVLADRIFSYVLPGRAGDLQLAMEQAREAERMGVAGVFLAERWENKEIASGLGALSQVTNRVRLVAGLTHFGTRHPLVLAGMAASLQNLSKGRFTLGFGRGVPPVFAKLGIPVINNQGMADYADILRRLWAGGTISYSGPAGNYPAMQFGRDLTNPPPIILGAIGPKTLALAGAHFDGVVLHPFLSVEGVRRSAAIVRDAAVSAGRSADAVEIFATVVTVPDSLGADVLADARDARAVSYFMHREIGKVLTATNGWDPAPLARLAELNLEHLEFANTDIAESRRQMAMAVSALPAHWLADGAATGSVGQCLERLSQYLDAGVDNVLLHGTAPQQQGDLMAAARKTSLKE
ncbi:MAG: TIGR03857 family LLM class F420-dependent oxidoreductase [Novosphingobium sp.]